MSQKRPAIPESIKRAVRKQCGFGCAICGMPFFEYDHIEEYADVKEHTADNLVLLCPNHHAAKTTHKLSKERIREAKKNPFNKERSHTSVLKIEPSRELLIQLGSNTVKGWQPSGKNAHHTVWINGKGFFTIHSDEGWLSISIIVTDKQGNIILSVKYGELIVYTSSWDYIYEDDNIKIREGLRNILLDFDFSDTKAVIHKAIFLDSHLDGFMVQDSELINIVEGVQMGICRNNHWHGLSYGGWGLHNLRSAPDVTIQGAFGFFFKY